jgi:hypothetical protein
LWYFLLLAVPQAPDAGSQGHENCDIKLLDVLGL